MNSKLSKIIIFVFLILTILIYFIFYPPFYAIMDECDYLTTTYTLKRGTFFLDKAGINPSTATVIGKKHMFSKYPPGNSILLLPLTFIHWRVGFLMNFIFYIMSFFIFYLLLKELGIPALFSLLFLLHPTLILYSRTMMSDIPSMFFILLGLYLIIKNKDLFAGFSLGFAILLRYSNLVIIIGVLIGYFLMVRKKSINILMGIIFFFIILSIYNIYVMEGFLSPLFLPTGAGAHSLSYLKTSGLYYLIALNIVYPFMLIVFIFSIFKKKLIFFNIVVFITVIFFSMYYYIDKGNSFFETIIKGQRFMIPIFPFFILIYADFLKKIRFIKPLVIFSSLFLIILAFGINLRFYNFQKEKLHLKDILYEKTKDADIIICNGETGKLFNPFFGNKKWRDYSIYGKLIINKDDVIDYDNIYLCFIESGKRSIEKSLFIDSLLPMFDIQKIFEIDEPSYLVIYKVIKN